MGHDKASSTFAFDNEQPRHRVFVEAFSLGNRLVTNSDYLEFMLDRGYARPELWLSDGWAARQAHRWEAPLYWEDAEPRRRASATSSRCTAFTRSIPQPRFVT